MSLVGGDDLPNRERCEFCDAKLNAYRIKSHNDFKKWAVRNHPDKFQTESNLDEVEAEFKDVINCKDVIIDKKICADIMINNNTPDSEYTQDQSVYSQNNSENALLLKPLPKSSEIVDFISNNIAIIILVIVILSVVYFMFIKPQMMQNTQQSQNVQSVPSVDISVAERMYSF